MIWPFRTMLPYYAVKWTIQIGFEWMNCVHWILKFCFIDFNLSINAIDCKSKTSDRCCLNFIHYNIYELILINGNCEQKVHIA